MNKYKEAYIFVDDEVKNQNSDNIHHLINLKELVEKETNGIYISNEKTTELLEALEELRRFTGSGIQVNKIYKKIQKILG